MTVNRAGRALVLAVVAALAVACGGRDDAIDHTAEGGELAEAATPDRTTTPSARVPYPGPLDGSLLSPDVLVLGERRLPVRLLDAAEKVPGVRKVVPLTVASVPLGERSITVAGVRLADYRRFAEKQTARMDAVWESLAAGDVSISHQIGRDFRQPLGGHLALRSARDEHRLRIGSYATTVPHIDAVVNVRRAEQLGMAIDNALLISAEESAVDGVEAALKRLGGKSASVQRLRDVPATTGSRQAAYLTGGAVAAAVGSFRYQYFEDGTVAPDPRWVAANIRTETVPIIGRVTCHRVMLPQLRAALAEIVERGLADRIDPGDFGGCYVPRFIGRDPRRGLSLHTWGIAVDLNVAGNQRGTVGAIDREVVAIFKRWGFAWGGDWDWTDPMHFELAALVR